MATTLDAPSVFEIILFIAIGFVVVIWGVQSKWKYISQVGDIQSEDLGANFSNPEIKMRVRCLAILFVICMLGMAFSLIGMILSRSTSFAIVALIFAVIGTFAHIFIDLDTSKR
jgi:hypothetical protein